MTWTIIGIIVSLGFGYVSRWIQDWRQKREYKRRVEAEHKLEVRKAVFKAVDEYEKEQKNIKNMPRSERMRYIADRVS